LSKLRLLIVDDSAYNRRILSDIFGSHPDLEVVGKAADGEEALRLVTMLQPDVVTLDLEMPRMDGFTFLRILMSKQPTPVIIVSSYAQKENVFKALELGALDFVTKPDQKIAPDARDLREQLLSKVLALRTVKPKLIRLPPTRRMPSGIFSDGEVPSSDGRPALKWSGDYAPRWIVAMACSTGGPGALIDIFGRIVKPVPAAFVVAQHMPDKFTRTFAERLAKRGPIRFSEAQDGDRLFAKSGLVCPGRQCMEIVVNETSFFAKLCAPSSTDRYVPSGDRLLRTAAIAGPRCVGVVLTGMGDDGVEGARAIRNHGGTVIVESAETAVVYGMPGAVVRAGLASKELPLPQIAEYLAALS
jgi:two-component system, chemotaxis family, protein-glutamate methylesterase/glutaminase